MDIEQAGPTAATLCFLVRAHTGTKTGQGPARWRLRNAVNAHLQRLFDYQEFFDACPPEMIISEVREAWPHHDALTREKQEVRDAFQVVKTQFPEIERNLSGPYAAAAHTCDRIGENT